MILSPVEGTSDDKDILCFVLAKESTVPSRILLYYVMVKSILQGTKMKKHKKHD